MYGHINVDKLASDTKTDDKNNLQRMKEKINNLSSYQDTIKQILQRSDSKKQSVAPPASVLDKPKPSIFANLTQTTLASIK